MAFVEGLQPGTGKVLVCHPSEGLIGSRIAAHKGLNWTMSHYVTPGQSLVVDTDQLQLGEGGRLIVKDGAESAITDTDNNEEAPHG